MDQFETQTTEQYLFNEMSDAERERFEEAMLGDDALFYDVATRENELVDLYCADKLTVQERERFERTLESLPARRQKVANAKTLGEFFETERESKTITIAERTGWASRFADLFSFRSPVIGFAAIGAILILGLASAFLLLENRRLGSLQNELVNAQRRADELTAQIENERETAGELTGDLDRERERIANLEKEIATLRGSDRDKPPPNDARPTMIATLVLSPIGVRGGPSPPVKRLELPAGVTRVSVLVNVPGETGDLVTVRLNGETIAENVRVRIRNGEKMISVSVPASRIKEQRNSIEILGLKEKRVSEYPFTMIRK